MTANPLLLMNEEPDEPGPLVELKTRLVLYTDRSPGPATARRVYDVYMARFEAGITGYRSTAFGSEVNEWTPSARKHFEMVELPNLRRQEHWGYVFGSEQLTDGHLFMFHGAKPATQAGWASVFRFDFEWNFDPETLRQFTLEVLQAVECVWGTAGYVLCPDEEAEPARANDQVYAWAMRYWGAQAQDLDVTMQLALTGLECLSWLTVIGPVLRERTPNVLTRARAIGFSAFEAGRHVIIQAEERPRLIDRNRRETLGNYPTLAEALLPLQVKEHLGFSGDLWDEYNTMRYIHRFTNPNDV